MDSYSLGNVGATKFTLTQTAVWYRCLGMVAIDLCQPELSTPLFDKAGLNLKIFNFVSLIHLGIVSY